jgi:hypothetical protein
MSDENTISFPSKIRKKINGENIIIIPKEYDEKIKKLYKCNGYTIKK